MTGTMELDGPVGEVGGVHQKTLASIDAGATLDDRPVPASTPTPTMPPAAGFASRRPTRSDQALRILDSVGGNRSTIGQAPRRRP